MSQRLVLIVGAADTGRAPMTAAMLGRLAAAQSLGWAVASAGVVGHDGDPAEPEARSAMLALGLDLSAHLARSLSADLAAEATLAVAVERGVARVVRAQHPALPVFTLGELAGRARDIPDPFRMQVGAWLQYAGEIEALLRAGLPRLRALVAGDRETRRPGDPDTRTPGDRETRRPGDREPSASPSAPSQPGVGPSAPVESGGSPSAPVEPSAARVAAVERAARLLALVIDMPAVVDWAAARAQLEADLTQLEEPQTGDDLARPYVALLRAWLAGAAGTPTADRAKALATAAARLRSPIAPADLEALARAIA